MAEQQQAGATHKERRKPIVLPFTAAQPPFLLVSRCVRLLYAQINSADAATQTVTFFDGANIVGNDVLAVKVPAGQSTNTPIGEPGLPFTNGVFIVTSAATLSGYLLLIDDTDNY